MLEDMGSLYFIRVHAAASFRSARDCRRCSLPALLFKRAVYEGFSVDASVIKSPYGMATVHRIGLLYLGVGALLAYAFPAIGVGVGASVTCPSLLRLV